MAVLSPPISYWELDRAANQKGSQIGIVMISSKRITIKKSLRLDFLAINNEAEYEAFIAGLSPAKRFEGEFVKVFYDSRLVVGQV